MDKPQDTTGTTFADMAPPMRIKPASAWLESSMLAENPPGAFRLAVATCGRTTSVPSLFTALVAGGWLRETEAVVANWPLAASLEAADLDVRAAWLATALQQVGIPLAARAVFADDAALCAACDWLATA